MYDWRYKTLERIFIPDEEKSISRIDNIIRRCFHTRARGAEFGCATNNGQLAALFEDRRCEYRWLLNHGGDPVTERDFRVEEVRIDRQNIPIIKTENTERGYEVWCGGEQLRENLNRPVKVEIEIATRKSKKSNDFSVYLVYPTRGLEISFNYGGTKIKNVREVSFFAGKCPYPEVIREEGKSIKLKISENEWIFPNSGVTFSWDM